MNRTTYEITMSTDGVHKVTVTVEDPGGIDAALAYAQGTFAKLMKSGTKPFDAGNDFDNVPICAFHHIPMVHMNGRKGPFWSCHEKNLDGSWCSFRPEVGYPPAAFQAR